MAGSNQKACTVQKTEETALKLLGLKWEPSPMHNHDYLFFLTRSPDSTRLATASSDFHLDSVTEIWDIPGRSLLYRLPTPNTNTMYLEWLQNQAYVTGGHDCLLTIWQEDQVTARLEGHQHWIKSLAACRSTLLSGDVGSVLGIWNLQNQQNYRMFLHPNHNEMELNVIMDLAFRPESEHCFYILQRTGRLSFADLRCKDLLQWTALLDMPKPSQMKVMENEYQLVVSARESQIKMLDLRTTPSTPVHCYSQHKSQGLPLSFDFLCYEKYLATGSDDGSAYIYETSTGLLVRKISLCKEQVQACCAEAPDSLSFFVTFNNARCLGLVDTVGTEELSEQQSAEQIKREYSKMAWNSAIGKFSYQVIMHVERLGSTVSFNNERILSVLRTAEDRESKLLLEEIEAEYRRQIEATAPAFVRDLTSFYEGKEVKYPANLPNFRGQIVRKSVLAPKVRREWSTALHR